MQSLAAKAVHLFVRVVRIGCNEGDPVDFALELLAVLSHSDVPSTKHRKREQG